MRRIVARPNSAIGQPRRVAPTVHSREAILTLLVLATFCALSCGCDTLYGVERTAYLQSLPSEPSVAASLRTVPGLQFSDPDERAPGQRVPDWPDPLEVAAPTTQRACAYCFHYQRAPAGGTIFVSEDADGRKALMLQCVWMNHVPTQKELTDARALMDVIYAALCKYIPQLPPPSAVHEDIKVPGY